MIDFISKYIYKWVLHNSSLCKLEQHCQSIKQTVASSSPKPEKTLEYWPWTATKLLGKAYMFSLVVRNNTFVTSTTSNKHKRQQCAAKKGRLSGLWKNKQDMSVLLWSGYEPHVVSNK